MPALRLAFTHTPVGGKTPAELADYVAGEDPVTGEPHHARVVLPHGFEFRESELASANFAVFGDLTFKHKGRTAVFSRFAYGPQGIVN